MDFNFLSGLGNSKKNKGWVLALGALGVGGYGAYKFYHSPSVAKKRKRLLKLFGALICVAEMVSDSAEAIGIVSKDLKEFIESDSDQIPNSLRQISKITRSDEFSKSLTRIIRALTMGILHGYKQETVESGVCISKKPDFSDRVMDKIFSDSGSGFVSVVVGSFARNMVLAYYSNKRSSVSTRLDTSSMRDDDHWKSDSVPRLVHVLCDDKCREVIGHCVQLFVSTAVTVFLDKTMHINPYDELFAGMTNPKHETQIREILANLCNGAIETLVRSSHRVLINDDTTAAQDYSYVNTKNKKGPNRDGKTLIQKARKCFDENEESGWMSKMSSTLAVPNNRKFVLDVTGTVTFETIKSFLAFILERIAECLKRSVDIIHEEVIDRGLEVVKHVSWRSSAIVTVCLSLSLDILNSPWMLVSN